MKPIKDWSSRQLLVLQAGILCVVFLIGFWNRYYAQTDVERDRLFYLGLILLSVDLLLEAMWRRNQQRK